MTEQLRKFLAEPLFGKGGPGSGPKSGHAFEGNQYTGGKGGGGEDKKAAERVAALQHVIREMKVSPEGRHANFGSDYNREDIEAVDPKWGKEAHDMGVRDFGHWENPPEARHEEDYDWQRPTKATVDKVKAIMAATEAKHPNVKLEANVGEKNWTYIRATSKK